jgi:hypothetical protein
MERQAIPGLLAAAGGPRGIQRPRKPPGTTAPCPSRTTPSAPSASDASPAANRMSKRDCGVPVTALASNAG